MNKQITQNNFITKHELNEAIDRAVNGLEERIGEMFSNALQLISEQFSAQDKKIDQLAQNMARIERKLDATIDIVDGHEVRIRRLERHKA